MYVVMTGFTITLQELATQQETNQSMATASILESDVSTKSGASHKAAEFAWDTQKFLVSRFIGLFPQILAEPTVCQQRSSLLLELSLTPHPTLPNASSALL